MLDRIGRITDGTVIDVQEIAVIKMQKPLTLLIYHYDVAGSFLQASQDVTYLRQWSIFILPSRPAHLRCDTTHKIPEIRWWFQTLDGLRQ